MLKKIHDQTKDHIKKEKTKKHFKPLPYRGITKLKPMLVKPSLEKPLGMISFLE